jgi:hypothetical protein
MERKNKTNGVDGCVVIVVVVVVVGGHGDGDDGVEEANESGYGED